MKKFYSVKNNSINSTNNKSSLSASSGNLFDKLTRRYSGIGTKFLRKSPGRKGSHDVVSGSYNMTGNQSDDLKPEIGLPILISKIDRTDLDAIPPGPYSPTLSTDSENEVFVDATSSLHNFAEIKFSFLPENTSSPNSSIEADSYDLVDRPARINKNKSKSAQNLHKSELKIFLKRTPSLEAIDDYENDADDEQCYDFPKKRMPPVEIKISSVVQLTQQEEQEQQQTTSDSSDINDEPPIVPVPDNNKIYTTTIQHHISSHSDNNNDECQNIPITYCSNSRGESIKSNNSNKSTNNSSVNDDDDDDDFDFKSVSLQSLNGKNIFLSFEELNEITRQINESEDFNQEIDYEYCEHRDNLKPSERRITLLRNKETNRFINLNVRKDKFAKKWTGVKHWISEERGKLKEVVQRHAALQRVGGNNQRTSDNNADDEDSSIRTDSLQGTEFSPTRSNTVSEEREIPENGSRKMSLQKSTTPNDSFEVCF